MASRLVAAAAASSSSSSSPLARLISRRGLAAEHHGPAKVNMWQDPLNPANWKEEHFVLASLAMWGGIFYGVSRLFSGMKKDKTTERLVSVNPTFYLWRINLVQKAVGRSVFQAGSRSTVISMSVCTGPGLQETKLHRRRRELPSDFLAEIIALLKAVCKFSRGGSVREHSGRTTAQPGKAWTATAHSGTGVDGDCAIGVRHGQRWQGNIWPP
uniref:Uncharacterized protein n=1 Tax=Leersia perrieri TaxID=77586 RepID=A0A0D9VVW9_9ORYZ